jgi:hypothetical protein
VSLDILKVPACSEPRMKFCGRNESLLCWYCDEGTRSRMQYLAHNLAVGAACCRAYWDGVRREFAHNAHAPWLDRDWAPGCGRVAP